MSSSVACAEAGALLFEVCRYALEMYRRDSRERMTGTGMRLRPFSSTKWIDAIDVHDHRQSMRDDRENGRKI
jgi:hypothetical protein